MYEIGIGSRLKRIAIAVCCFFLVSYVMVLIQEWSDTRASRYPPEVFIFDLGWEVFPFINWKGQPDIFVNLALFFFFVCAATSRGMFLVQIQRFFSILAIVYIFRAVCVALTTYPIPPTIPHHRPFHTSRPFTDALAIITGSKATYSDLIFSGHTSVLMLTALFCLHYGNDNYEWHVSQYGFYHSACVFVSYVFFILFNIVGALGIVATHFHNSVDVFLALLITGYTFHAYHCWINHNQEWLNRRMCCDHCNTFNHALGFSQKLLLTWDPPFIPNKNIVL